MADDESAVPDMTQEPVVQSHEPAGSANYDAGETIVITGSGFLGTTSVSIGPFSCPWFEVISDSEIHATAAAYDSTIVTDPPVAKVKVWKNSFTNDTANLAEWTWAGWDLAALQQANQAGTHEPSEV